MYMTIGILEPILAGLTVGIINKLMLNNSELWLWCTSHTTCSTSSTINIDQHEDDISSSTPQSPI